MDYLELEKHIRSAMSKWEGRGYSTLIPSILKAHEEPFPHCEHAKLVEEGSLVGLGLDYKQYIYRCDTCKTYCLLLKHGGSIAEEEPAPKAE